MNKNQFRAYFQRKESQRQRDEQQDDDVVVTVFLASASNVATVANLAMAKGELEKLLLRTRGSTKKGSC